MTIMMYKVPKIVLSKAFILELEERNIQTMKGQEMESGWRIYRALGSNVHTTLQLCSKAPPISTQKEIIRSREMTGGRDETD